MHIDIKPDRNKKGFFTVTPGESIDTDSHDDFRRHLLPILIKSTKGILIDLKKVDYISSAGLGVLFSINRLMKENKGSLLFCHLKPQIERLFDVVKVLPKENQFKSIEEADRFFYAVMNKEIEKQAK